MRRWIWTCLCLAFASWTCLPLPRDAWAEDPAAKPESSEAAAAAETATPAAATAEGAAADPLAGLDELIEAQLAESKVPGLAIAIVKDGQVIHSKGYGLRDVARQLPVTSQTLFAIGSVTKSFTATLGGMLVDDGKLDWDQPIRAWLPDFQLKDPVATAQMTLRDLCTHRSGLPRHDMVWYASSLSRQEIYDRLRYLEPSKPFRSLFQYNNLMFMTAGFLEGRVCGSSWEDLVRDRILLPLEMTRSNFSVTVSQQSDDFALPYDKVQDQVTAIPFRNIDAIGPAGSINSCVDEMIRYVQFHIEKGMHGEKRLLSAASADQIQSAQMVTPGAGPFEELGQASYGLGLMVATYRGEKIVEHGGGIDGFISYLSFLPRKKLGVIVLTNSTAGNTLPTMLTYQVYDRLLGLEPIDWAARLKPRAAEASSSANETAADNKPPRREGTSPSHDLAEYAGTYRHPAYGDVVIKHDGSALSLEARDTTLALEHFHYDVFNLPEHAGNPLSNMKVQFFYDKQGTLDRLAMTLEASVDDIVFQRAANEALKDKAYLARLVGEYDLGPAKVTVALQGETTLTLTVPGQPTYTLEPGRANNFDLKGLSGFNVEFKQDEAGTITELIINQPNGVFHAKRL